MIRGLGRAGRMPLTHRRRHGLSLWATMRGDVSGFMTTCDDAYNLTYTSKESRSIQSYGMIRAQRTTVSGGQRIIIDNTWYINYADHDGSLYSTGVSIRVLLVWISDTSSTVLSPPGLQYETTVSAEHTRNERAWGHV